MSQKSVVLAGAGGMGRAWAKVLSQSPAIGRIVWVDLIPAQAKKAAQELGSPKIATEENLASALKLEGIDFVVDVTPPESHRDVVLMALGAGKPVLGEKPMAASRGQAREIVKAAEKAGLLYVVSQNYRYNNRFREFQQLVQQELGELGILNLDFYIGAHFGGFRAEMASPLLMDMAIHSFDLARAVSGKDAVSVFAEEFNPKWSWFDGAASAVAHFTLSNGARFTYRGSWCAEGEHTPWHGRWRAVGSKGTIVWDGENKPTGQKVLSTNGFTSEFGEFSEVHSDSAEGIEGVLADFLQALDGGPLPQTVCYDNEKSLAMVFAAIESARTGEKTPVRI